MAEKKNQKQHFRASSKYFLSLEIVRKLARLATMVIYNVNLSNNQADKYNTPGWRHVLRELDRCRFLKHYTRNKITHQS